KPRACSSRSSRLPLPSTSTTGCLRIRKAAPARTLVHRQGKASTNRHFRRARARIYAPITQTRQKRGKPPAPIKRHLHLRQARKRHHLLSLTL
ncbi:MAG: hypothetical protein LQ341_007726, partial [Variospora aurantia]